MNSWGQVVARKAEASKRHTSLRIKLVGMFNSDGWWLLISRITQIILPRVHARISRPPHQRPRQELFLPSHEQCLPEAFPDPSPGDPGRTYHWASTHASFWRLYKLGRSEREPSVCGDTWNEKADGSFEGRSVREHIMLIYEWRPLKDWIKMSLKWFICMLDFMRLIFFGRVNESNQKKYWYKRWKNTLQIQRIQNKIKVASQRL